MKKIQRLGSIILILVVSNAAALAKNARLDEAISHFNNGRFQTSIELLESLVAAKTLEQTDYLTASEYLAVAYLSKDETHKVEEIFAGILKKNPDYRPSDQWWPHQKLMNIYFQTVKRLGKSLKPTREEGGLKTIAIMDFENNSVENSDKYQNLGKALSKIVTGDFSLFGGLKVVERERIQFILDELELTDREIGGKKVVDASAAPRIGKLLGAQSFVFGSFIQIGKKFRIDARLVKTETSEILKTFSVDGNPNDIFELAKKLTLEITKGLEVEVKRAEKKELDKFAGHAIPIEAVALFGDAMSKANQEQYRAALSSLEKAIATAPNFAKAKEMLNVLKPLALAKS